jgi:enoyl-CoA hydratase/carnithine racemase
MLTIRTSRNVMTVTLQHPPVNAIGGGWLQRFEDILDGLPAERACTVLHIRSAQKVFCAGADLKEMRERMAAKDGADRTYAFVAAIQRLYSRIERLPQVTVAEIGGAALGGGLELALACDLRIAADEAKIGLPEVRLGLVPGGGGTQRLTRLCGSAIAARLILGGELLDGAEARALGLVHWSVPRSKLAKQASEIVAGIAALPGPALAAGKACIAAAGRPGRGGFADELEFTRVLFDEPDTRRRVLAFLAEANGASAHDKRGAA